MGGPCHNGTKGQRENTVPDFQEPWVNIWPNLRGPEPSSAGPFRESHDSRPIQCFKCWGWGHPKQLFPSQLNYTLGGSGTGISLPDNGQATQGSSSQQPISSTIDMQISWVVQKYHNPDPLLRLIGLANEATIIIEAQQILVLIDSGAQISTMSKLLVQALGLPVYKLNNLIEIEVSGEGTTPYSGYVKARLTIPGIEQMGKDLLFMVTNDSPYMQRVPIQLRTLHIWEALQLATDEERRTLSPAWLTVSFSPQTLSKSGVLEEPNFDLNQVKEKVKLTKAVTIKPFQTVHVSGFTECDQHFKRVNVIVESDPKIDYETTIPINGYTMLKPGSSRVSVGIRNISCKSIMIPAKTTIAKIATVNVVPHSFAPNIENNKQLQ